MEQETEWDTPLWNTTGFRLIKLGELAMAATAATFDSLEIDSRQFHVLAAAAAMSNPSQKELSRVLGVDPNAMVGVIDELERLGLAQRTRNTEDRRRYIVAPTDKAQRVLRETRAAIARAEESFFADLSEHERQSLHDLAGRLLIAHPRVTKRE